MDIKISYFFKLRYAKKCLIPAQRFFDNLVPLLSERTMTFYDLSIPFYDEKNDDKNGHQFQLNGGHSAESKNMIKRYAMPMIIKNIPDNKVSGKTYLAFKNIKYFDTFLCQTIRIKLNELFLIQKEDKVHTTRFFLVDSISGVSASTSTSFNERQNEESAETSNQGLRLESNENSKTQKEIEYPTIIRYLKRMEIKYVLKFTINIFFNV